MLLEVGAGLGLGGEGHQLEVAEGLEAVAEAVDLVIDGQDAELAAAGLGVEAEQQPVDEGERLLAEVLGGDLLTPVRKRPRQAGV